MRRHFSKLRKSWARKVRKQSNAMDLPRRIFTHAPAAIASGLTRVVFRRRRTKGTAFQSAMSMLNRYVNRVGRGLSARNRARLQSARKELHKAFGRS